MYLDCGNGLTLRPMNDLTLTTAYIDWFNTAAVKAGLRLGPAPLGRQDHAAHVAQCKAAGYGLFTLHDQTGQLLHYYFRVTRKPAHGVGELDLAADHRDQARLARIRAAGAALLDHAFGPMKLRKVNVRMDRANIAARYHADHAPFVREGYLRAEGALRNGRRDDVLVYGLLATEYLRHRAGQGPA